MDWIDPENATGIETTIAKKTGKSSRQRKKGGHAISKKPSKPLKTQVSAALAQPIEVWSVAFDHALSKLKWPTECTAENTFLWSAVIQEQAEVLVRAGMSAKKLAAIISGKAAGSEVTKIVVAVIEKISATAFGLVHVVRARFA